MDILTFVLIGVLVLLSLSCFMEMGKKKGGFCCAPSTDKEAKGRRSSPVTPQSKELQKIYSQMDQVEKVNQSLLKEMERLKKEKGSTT